MENQQINVLAVGRNAGIMEVVLRLLNSRENRRGTVVLSDEAAIAAARTGSFDIVLLCGGINANEEKALRAALLEADSSLKIIQHYGGGSGLLENELLQAMAAQNNQP